MRKCQIWLLATWQNERPKTWKEELAHEAAVYVFEPFNTGVRLWALVLVLIVLITLMPQKNPTTPSLEVGQLDCWSRVPDSTHRCDHSQQDWSAVFVMIFEKHVYLFFPPFFAGMKPCSVVTPAWIKWRNCHEHVWYFMDWGHVMYDQPRHYAAIKRYWSQHY